MSGRWWGRFPWDSSQVKESLIFSSEGTCLKPSYRRMLRACRDVHLSSQVLSAHRSSPPVWDYVTIPSSIDWRWHMSRKFSICLILHSFYLKLNVYPALSSSYFETLLLNSWWHVFSNGIFGKKLRFNETLRMGCDS